METQLQLSVDRLIQIRLNFKKVVESLPEEKLFEIPKGLNNNIMWNYAHNIVTQQILLYKLAGLPLSLDEKLVETYKKGSVASSAFVPGLRDELILASYTTLELLQQDILSPKKFANFQIYPTSFGIELTSFKDALEFNLVHESLHLGYAMAIRKMVI